MTIEVRQLLIRSVVGDAPPEPAQRAAEPGHETLPDWVEPFRLELLRACRQMLDEQRRRQLER